MPDIDIAEIKSLITQKRLTVTTQDGHILLDDTKTGERIRIGSFTPVFQSNDGCDVCRSAEGPIEARWSTPDLQDLTSSTHTETARFCPHCGRQLIFAE